MQTYVAVFPPSLTHVVLVPSPYTANVYPGPDARVMDIHATSPQAARQRAERVLQKLQDEHVASADRLSFELAELGERR